MHKVTICGIDTSTLPRLTAARSEELLALIEKGDAAAKELFLRANMRLVLSVVADFPPRRRMPTISSRRGWWA